MFWQFTIALLSASAAVNVTCPAGYSRVGDTCTDLNECAVGLSNCDSRAVCVNSIGSFSCSCSAGFIAFGANCDLDECAVGQHNCFPNFARCFNTLGSFSCSCIAGYSGSGVSCVKIPLCMSAPCDPHATCTELPDAFSCRCNAGFFGNGTYCDALTTTLNSSLLIGPGAVNASMMGTAFSVGDIDGDGASNDMIIGSPEAGGGDGALILVYRVGTYLQTFVRIDGRQGAGDQLGVSLALADFNGDAILDALVGTRNGFLSLMLFSSDGRVISSSIVNATAILNSTEISTLTFGSAVAFGPDLNSDSIPDAAVSAPEIGSVWIIYFARDASVKSSYRIDYRNTVPMAIGLGTALAFLDVDGDNSTDLIATAPTPAGGQVHVFFLKVSGGNPVRYSSQWCLNSRIPRRGGGDLFGSSLSVLPTSEGNTIAVGSPGTNSTFIFNYFKNGTLQNFFRVGPAQPISAFGSASIFLLGPYPGTLLLVYPSRNSISFSTLSGTSSSFFNSTKPVIPPPSATPSPAVVNITSTTPISVPSDLFETTAGLARAVIAVSSISGVISLYVGSASLLRHTQIVYVLFRVYGNAWGSLTMCDLTGLTRFDFNCRLQGRLTGFSIFFFAVLATRLGALYLTKFEPLKQSSELVAVTLLWGIFHASGVSSAGLCKTELPVLAQILFAVLQFFSVVIALAMCRLFFDLRIATFLEFSDFRKPDPAAGPVVKIRMWLKRQMNFGFHFGRWVPRKFEYETLFNWIVHPIVKNFRRSGVGFPIFDLVFRNLVGWLAGYYSDGARWLLLAMTVVEFAGHIIIRPFVDLLSNIFEPCAAATRIVAIGALLAGDYQIVTVEDARIVAHISIIIGALFLYPCCVLKFVPVFRAMIWTIDGRLQLPSTLSSPNQMGTGSLQGVELIYPSPKISAPTSPSARLTTAPKAVVGQQSRRKSSLEREVPAPNLNVPIVEDSPPVLGFVPASLVEPDSPVEPIALFKDDEHVTAKSKIRSDSLYRGAL